MNCILYIDDKIVEVGVFTYESLSKRVEYYFNLDNDVIDLKVFESTDEMNGFMDKLFNNSEEEENV